MSKKNQILIQKIVHIVQIMHNKIVQYVYYHEIIETEEMEYDTF